MPTLLDQVLALLKLLLPEIAGNQRAAVSIDAVGEVRAGHAGLVRFEADQLPLVNKLPLLHQLPCK